ncbi:O-linked N-acetylglucosamine transferase, SPINDLY family protein [Azospirillum doebereinerae]
MASIDEAFALATRHHDGGALDKAELLYGRILAAAPRHAHARHRLGLLKGQTGRPLEGERDIAAAVAISGRNAAFHRDLATLRLARGAGADALAAFGWALALQPDEALTATAADLAARLADEAADRGDGRVAVVLYRRAVALAPGHVMAAYNHAVTLRDAGAMAEATASFRHVQRLRPDLAPVYGNLGELLRRSGRTAQAIRAFRCAVALDPADAGALGGLGAARLDAGQVADGVASLRHALTVRPDDRGMATLLAGGFLALAGRAFAAAAWAPAEGALRRTLALLPNDPAAWTSLGAVQQERGVLPAAIRLHRRAIALDPGGADGQAQSNLGVALMGDGALAEAAEALRLARALRPTDPPTASNLLFSLCFNADEPLETVFAEHCRYGRDFARPALPHALPRADEAGRRLRVGYLSPDFRRYPGPAFHYLLPLFENHDPAGFDIRGYHDHPTSDAVTGQFQAVAGGWTGVHALDEAALAETIRRDGIDILVDCAGHMAGNRLPLFARKPAPLQISYPLYPNTTGLPTMDYRISDRHFSPPWADALHSEALIRLPDAHVCYRPAPSRIVPPVEAPWRAGTPFTFASFNTLAKLTPTTVAAWAAILRAVPDSRLMLKWRGLANAGMSGRVLDAFAAAGVPAGRITLRAPTPDPYEDYRLVDLCLDPLFANGGTTTCDALWMGVPVLTLCGRAPFSRVGLCHLTMVGLEELVTHRVEDYIATAIRLSTGRDGLEAMRAGLRARTGASALMDAPRYVRHLETAYRLVWKRRCDGLPPAPLLLSPDGAPG